MENFSGDWNSLIVNLPGANILQTSEWGQIKTTNGWQPQTYIWKDTTGKICAAALVLIRKLNRFLPFSILYIPRGPLLDWSDDALRIRVLDDIQRLARTQNSIYLKIDPEVVLGRGVPGKDGVDDPTGQKILNELSKRGWVFSDSQIQFRNTAILDLSSDEEAWLGQMKQKTRYNLRLSQRKGVQIRLAQTEDLPLLYRMYAVTSIRDGFVIRDEDYYLTVWKTFMEKDMAAGLIAESEGESIAAVMVFYFAGRAWYLYGMSTEAQRDKMPNYLLQWEAMRFAKAKGCQVYDLWGAPDIFDETDSMWGVFRFKEGLGAKVVRTMGAWDYPNSKTGYMIYNRVIPRLLDVMRKRGKEKTYQEANK
jgi:lipid II:glycine glycyltransferase (peptidoglycan interpeptide bridge formation enzyme)